MVLGSGTQYPLSDPLSPWSLLQSYMTSGSLTFQRPATLFNSSTGLEEIYYRGTNGDLYETYFANGHQYNQDLGQAMS